MSTGMPVDIEKTQEKARGEARNISGPQVLGRFFKTEQNSQRDDRAATVMDSKEIWNTPV